MIHVFDSDGNVIETHEHKGEASLVAISERVRVSTDDVRSDLAHRQRVGGCVTTENVDIVADEADGAGSEALAVSALVLELGAN